MQLIGFFGYLGHQGMHGRKGGTADLDDGAVIQPDLIHRIAAAGILIKMRVDADNILLAADLDNQIIARTHKHQLTGPNATAQLQGIDPAN